jgi:hypothetical protein
LKTNSTAFLCLFSAVMLKLRFISNVFCNDAHTEVHEFSAVMMLTI